MMWNSARAWGYVAHDPFDGLVLPKRGLVQALTFSLEDTQAHHCVLPASLTGTFYAILAETGIRGGEICALRVADLDLVNAVIHVRQSVWRGQIQTVKSRKGNRRFPISTELVEHLRIYLKNLASELLGPAVCNENRHAVGSQSGSEAQISSVC